MYENCEMSTYWWIIAPYVASMFICTSRPQQCCITETVWKNLILYIFLWINFAGSVNEVIKIPYHSIIRNCTKSYYWSFSSLQYGYRVKWHSSIVWVSHFFVYFSPLFCLFRWIEKCPLNEKHRFQDVGWDIEICTFQTHIYGKIIWYTTHITQISTTYAYAYFPLFHKGYNSYIHV